MAADMCWIVDTRCCSAQELARQAVEQERRVAAAAERHTEEAASLKRQLGAEATAKAAAVAQLEGRVDGCQRRASQLQVVSNPPLGQGRVMHQSGQDIASYARISVSEA